jgi:hypothetical protein
VYTGGKLSPIQNFSRVVSQLLLKTTVRSRRPWFATASQTMLLKLMVVGPQSYIPTAHSQRAGPPPGNPSPASYLTVSWYKLPGLLEYSGGWVAWCWCCWSPGPPGRNPSVTTNAFALYDELVEVDHLLGWG